MALATENSIQLDNSNCRICLFAKQNLCPLFRRGLSMKVMKLADIKMYEGDGLPSSICLDCEFEVKRCTNFVAQIQQADAKLREMLAEKEKEVNETCVNDKEIVEGLAEGEEQEASTSQIEIEEFNVKQEITSLDNFIDEKEDFHSDSDHDHFGGGLDNIDQPEDDDELNPLNHVDVVEDINRGDQMDIFTDPLGQEEPLIESHTTEIDPSTDPLTYMKQEAVAMDVDKNMPEVPGPSSSVRRAHSTLPLPVSPQILLDKGKGNKFKMVPQNILCLSWNEDKSVSNEDKQHLEESFPDPIFMSSDVSNESESNISICRICNVECGSSELLTKHKENNGYICRVCDAEFDQHSELETHFQIHCTYKCRKCNARFLSRTELALHWRERHSNELFTCDICNKTYTINKNLIRHKSREHSGLKGVWGSCVVCGKTFTSRILLDGHLKSSHTVYENIKCKLCNTSALGPDRMRVHMKLVHRNNIPARCDTCGKVFKSAKTLASHQKIHDKLERLCEICGKSIEGEIKMKDHMKQEHPKKGVFSCKICNETFGEEASLLAHRKKHHPRKRSLPNPVFCEICGKIFKTPNILKIHKLTHTGERPYKCETCGASFKQEGTLKTHLRVHSDIGKYFCDYCGLSFKWKQPFTRHVNNCSAREKNGQNGNSHSLDM